MNRSLVDSNLNFSKRDLQGEAEKAEEQKYEAMYKEGPEMIEDYDFTNMQSMLDRQAKILKKMKVNEPVAKIEVDGFLDLEATKTLTFIFCMGGSFSIAVYQGDNCVFHKSDKKYVIRKKQGKR